MDCEAPIPAPAPCVLADLTAQRAWDENVSDECRQLHEWNADTVRLLVVKTGDLSRRCEMLEAYCHTLMTQKGGAA